MTSHELASNFKHTHYYIDNLKVVYHEIMTYSFVVRKIHAVSSKFNELLLNSFHMKHTIVYILYNYVFLGFFFFNFPTKKWTMTILKKMTHFKNKIDLLINKRKTIYLGSILYNEIFFLLPSGIIPERFFFLYIYRWF